MGVDTVQQERKRKQNNVLAANISLYESQKWPTDAHGLNCISMFSAFINSVGVSSAVRSFYHIGRLPNFETRFNMWTQCLALKQKSIQEQQVRLASLSCYNTDSVNVGKTGRNTSIC